MGVVGWEGKTRGASKVSLIYTLPDKRERFFISSHNNERLGSKKLCK